MTIIKESSLKNPYMIVLCHIHQGCMMAWLLVINYINSIMAVEKNIYIYIYIYIYIFMKFSSMMAHGLVMISLMSYIS